MQRVVVVVVVSGIPVGSIWVSIGSVVNNCYFLCNFIFVISAPLDSIIICAHMQIYVCMDICEKGTIIHILLEDS